jgi:agmatine/peptidylarginine deiminase
MNNKLTLVFASIFIAIAGFTSVVLANIDYFYSSYEKLTKNTEVSFSGARISGQDKWVVDTIDGNLVTFKKVGVIKGQEFVTFYTKD